MTSLGYALNVADEFIVKISPFCEWTEIVGSIRRLRKQVNDIDILVIPKFEETKDETLFGETVRINTLDRKLSSMCIDNILNFEMRLASHPIVYLVTCNFRVSPVELGQVGTILITDKLLKRLQQR